MYIIIIDMVLCRDTGLCNMRPNTYFKKLAQSQSIGNFITLPRIVAVRHQLLQCYVYATDGSILDLIPEIGPDKDYNYK